MMSSPTTDASVIYGYGKIPIQERNDLYSNRIDSSEGPLARLSKSNFP